MMMAVGTMAVGTMAVSRWAVTGRRLGTGLALMGVLALGGCINLGGGKPPAQLLSLKSEAVAPAGSTFAGKSGQAVVVFEPEADRSLAVQRVPVRLNDTSIAYLKGAVWVEPPTRLFRDLLAETLRAKTKRIVFEDDQPEARGGLRLSGRLLAMGYDARTHSVVVRYDALRQGGDGTMAVRRFEAVEKDVAPEANAVAPALNRAANKVAEQVADWIG